MLFQLQFKQWLETQQYDSKISEKEKHKRAREEKAKQVQLKPILQKTEIYD